MAIITKIRNYSGLLIAVIGIGLAAFVLGDFLGYGPMQQRRFDVGKVEGTPITDMHFRSLVDQRINNIEWQQERTVEPDEAFQIRNQVWNEMIREMLMEDILENVGLHVTIDDIINMIRSDDPHPIFRQNFTNPQTGVYDKQAAVNYVLSIGNNLHEREALNQWNMLVETISLDIAENKYHQLIGRAYFAPAPMAAADFKNRNVKADIRFINKPLASVDDADIRISDRELRDYYEDHKHRFRQEASRSITYVSLPVLPSDEDRQREFDFLMEQKEDFAETSKDNIASYIRNMESDKPFNPTFRKQGTLSPNIDPEIFDIQVGSIIGPYMEDNFYVLAKLVDVQMRPDSMRASRILIAYDGAQGVMQAIGRSKEDAEQKADSILQLVRNNPGRFATLASQLSDDPNAAMNQGDLDWFPDGAMVTPFNEAVVENPTGSFLTVETGFGFHVVHVTGKSAPVRKVQVAKLAREIKPGRDTENKVSERAHQFASMARSKNDFVAAAEEAELNVRQADRVFMMDMTLPGVEGSRTLVQWAFNDKTRIGDISEVENLQHSFVVATLTKKIDAGIPSFDQIRPNIMEIAVRERKKEMIADELKALMDGRSLEDIASSLELEVKEAENLSFSSRTIPGLGAEPALTGTLFASKEPGIIGPIKGNNGVFVVEILRMDEAIVPDDLTQARNTIQNAFKNRVRTQALEAIKDNARIEDNRANYF